MNYAIIWMFGIGSTGTTTTGEVGGSGSNAGGQERWMIGRARLGVVWHRSASSSSGAR